MGLLTLPQSSLVFIDANVVIYSVEKIEPYATLLLPMWEAAKAGDIALIGSELLLLETLVKPLREKDTQLESIYRNLLLASNELRLLSADASVLGSAARLCATAGLKTPDAIHAATALLVGSTIFITNDVGFRRAPGLSVTVLDEILAAP